LKILIVANSESFIQNFKLELLEELAKSYEVIVIPLNQSNARSIGVNSIDSIKLSRRGINPFYDLKFLASMFNHIRLHRPNLVLTFTVKPNVYTGIITRIYKIKHIQVVTGLGTALISESSWISLIVRMLYRLSVHKNSIHVFENSHNLNYFKKFKLSRVSVLVNGSGVNLSRYRFAEYPLEEEIRFIFVGRLMKEKGIIDLLRTMSEMIQKGIKFSLTVVGNKDETIDLSDWENKPWVTFIGYTNNVLQHYIESHCIIHPSYHEGMSNVLLEAAAVGRPAIASDIPGCHEIVEHEITGYLFERKNVAQLKNAIIAFLNMSYINKKLMGERAREKVEKLFDRKTVDQEYINLIESIGRD